MIDFQRGTGRAAPSDIERRHECGGLPKGERRTQRGGPPEAERLGDEIAELTARLHAATYELLVKLREFDELEGWSGGFRSCAHWLSWRTGIAPGAAREKVRVARALAPLPLISDAMRHGRLSYAKVRALTRIASASNEARLLEIALHGTAAHVEKVVRAWRRVDRNEEVADERARHERRKLDLWIDEDGSWTIRGRLDPEVGALLARALDAAGVALHGRKREPKVSGSQRRADAIGLLAESALRMGFQSESPVHRADRFQVVVHVDEQALRSDSEEGKSVLEGVRVPAETSRRIACDTDIVRDPESGVGRRGTGVAERRNAPRRTRTIPASVRRALEHRDRGCRFPGCGLRFCDAHHVVHWADGGATRLHNLVLLCRRHHRAVHEEGFGVTIEKGEVAFRAPDGRPIPEAPCAPSVGSDPVTRLQSDQARLGIDASTPTPAWTGERLDLDWSVHVLRAG